MVEHILNQIKRVVYPVPPHEAAHRKQPEPTIVDQDGVWYSKEHKDYVMSQKQFWEDQHKLAKADPENAELSEQYASQQNYIKSTPEEKRSGKFFKDLYIESVVDEEAIKSAKQMGLTDPAFLTGRMSNELVQKMCYMKSKHRTSLPLRKWSQDGYFFKQNEVCKIP